MTRGWHFTGKTLRDGRPVPKDGELLKFDGRPILCEQGLHFSVHPFDALQYAPGATLCLVECSGVVVMGDDKGVCTERAIITRMDATPLLRYFARQQALSVLHLYPGEPQQCVLDFLAGDDSARDAAWAAARDAAGDAARAAARAAAGAAAWAAVWAAAGDAARAAAGDAARAAAGDAARAAARAAARDAAGDAAGDDFKTLVTEAFEDWL
jgi:hypothetical protein